MQAIGAYVIISVPDSVERKIGGIILPSNNATDFLVGNVVSVGSDIEDGKLHKNSRVFILNTSRKINLGQRNNETTYAVEYDEIIAVVDDDEDY